jgi:rhodanese-related sulfurtransferase
VISLAVAAAGWVLLVTRRLRRYPISTTFETPPEKEWRETGIPRGALAISIHDSLGKDGFLEKVRAAIGEKPGRPVATICAAGVRSDRTQTWLREAGYAPVLNVREGMLGRWRPFEPAQPGWLERGLPTEPWAGS